MAKLHLLIIVVLLSHDGHPTIVSHDNSDDDFSSSGEFSSKWYHCHGGTFEMQFLKINNIHQNTPTHYFPIAYV